MLVGKYDTSWKMSKYGVISGPYFPVFGPEKTPYSDTFHTVWMLLISVIYKIVVEMYQNLRESVWRNWNLYEQRNSKIYILLMLQEIISPDVPFK